MDSDLMGYPLPVKLTISGPASTLGLLLPEEKQDCALSHLTCLPSCLQTMGDVKLAASAHVSKTSLSVDPSRVGSMPLTEAPAFILPPRNLCIREGATAKFEGRVRRGLDGRLRGEGCGGVRLLLEPFPHRDGPGGDLVCFGPTCKVNICHLPYLFFYDFAMLEDSGRGCGGTPKCSTVNVGHVWVCNT